MKNYIIIIVLIVFCLSSCKKFLDESPNSKQVPATTTTDCQALLDDFNTMNSGYPGDTEASSDNYYLLPASWAALTAPEDRDIYIWAAKAQRLTSTTQWSNPYKVAYYANIVLETLEKLKETEEVTKNTLRGSALFFRAFAFHQVAQLYAKPYDHATASQDLGIPVRETTALEVESERGTVKQTYDSIVQDLNEAIQLLPVKSSIQTRPNKAAAYALLARVYLSMEDYVNAGKMADECLKLYGILIDYNTLTATANVPISIFNNEVIFHAVTSIARQLNPAIAKIDPDLYTSYISNDLRKTVFFKANTVASGGGFAFKGGYNGIASTIIFIGLATDEIYLIRAECNARAGKTAEALKDLNDLLITRWKYERDLNGNIVKDVNGNNVSTYIPYTANNAEEALAVILTERRKELLMRGIRWSDLRRLNKDSRFKKELTRTLNSSTYSLPPNDLRYVLLIPQDVMELTNFQQNPRQPN